MAAQQPHRYSMALNYQMHSGTEDLARKLHASEQERSRLVAEHEAKWRRISTELQAQTTELRTLRDTNRRLADENKELRELNSFLDEERERCQGMASEWQKFGQRVSSILYGKMDDYQQKVGVLEERQGELVKENLRLKHLCLFLNEKCGNPTDVEAVFSTSADAKHRNPHGGSTGSYSTFADKPGRSSSMPALETKTLPPVASSVVEPPSTSSSRDITYSDMPNDSNRYESQQVRLQEGSSQLATNSSQGLPTSPKQALPPSSLADADYRTFALTAEPAAAAMSDRSWQASHSPRLRRRHSRPFQYVSPMQSSSTQHESVSDAMKVIQIRDELDKLPPTQVSAEASNHTVLDDAEKALVREMCNVAWKKLGDSVPGYKTAV